MPKRLSLLQDIIQRTQYVFVWLSRITHCKGFGIQSPTDFRFVNTVVNEHWPYYAYEHLGTFDTWKRRHLGLLYFRIANWRQPSTVYDGVGVMCYLKAGCAKVHTSSNGERVDMAVVSLGEDVDAVLDRCDDSSVALVEDIKAFPDKWKQLLASSRVVISYDLYYCGILLFDRKRTKQHYIVNY